MRTQRFPEIAHLLNEVSLAKFSLEPTHEVQEAFAVYEGSYFLSNGDEIPARVLYVSSAASAKGLRAAIRKVAIPPHTEVVYPPTAATPATAIDWQSVGAKKVVSSKDYLIAFMRAELGRYREHLAKLLWDDFEMPSVETPVGLTSRIPNPLELFLGESQSSGDEGQIAVLLAEAGHGKTYLSEWVAGRIAATDERVIPIFVSAKQWTEMPRVSGATLDEVICNSFRAFGCPVRWAEGNERDFLRVALRLGVFRLIFDGFDEFALQSGSDSSVREALNSLLALTADTGARVLVTARTSFWEAQASEEADELAAKLDVYVLQPFDPQKAENYFRRKLGGDESKVHGAKAVFQQLYRANTALAGRGVVLRLVADLAEKGGALAVDTRSEPVSWLMHSLCQRDQERQKLPMGPDKQLVALREFIMMTLAGVAPTDETFGLALQYAADLDDSSMADTLLRFSSHALITRASSGVWNLVNPQVELTLLGQVVVDAALTKSARGELDLSRLNVAAQLRPDQEIDLAQIILSLIDCESNPADPVDRCSRVIGLLLRASPMQQSSLLSPSLFRRLATHVALRSRDVSGAKDRRERTQALLRLTPGASLEGLHFTKTLSSFDLSGVTLRRCLFEDVTFSACKFDDATSFVGCRFEGGNAYRCEGLGRSAFIDCTYTTSGHEFVRNQQVRDGSRAYSAEDLNRDLRSLVEKFVRQAGAAFRSVAEDDLTKGKISMSPHIKEVVAAFVRHILDHVHISGTPSGGYVVKASARESVLFFYQNNSLVGDMAEAATTIRSRVGVQ